MGKRVGSIALGLKAILISSIVTTALQRVFDVIF